MASALDHFGLREPRVIGCLPASPRNDSFVVEDARGHRHVLRRYRRNPERERIEFQLAFQQHLLEAGFPTSRVAATRSGDLVLALAGDFWALFTYVEGVEYDYGREDQVREAGRRLAELHRTSQGFRFREVLSDTIPDVRRWWTDGEAELRRLAGMFVGRGVEAEIDFLHEWHAQLLRAWPREMLDTLPAAWVHGDYHGRNMVFAADRLVGLFDFDVVHRGFRIEDVALSLFAFGREHRESNRIRARTARAFVDGYERGARLTDLERQALPMMTVLVHARAAPRYALRERSGDDAARALRTHVDRMRALHAQMASLAPTLFTTTS